MSADVIELRPGIRVIEDPREPYGPHISPLNLADPAMQVSVFRECRNYALHVHGACYATTSDVELAKAINVCRSLASILEAVAAGRMAGRAIEVAREVDAACRAAMEAAERL